jgi:hypothetical protein
MTESDRKEFIAQLLALGELFGKELSSAAMEMYFQALKPYSIDKIKKAVVQITRTHIYNTMPRPAEFIQFIDPPEDIDEKARLAMDKAFDMMEQHGAYATVAFDDPVIYVVIDRCYGGWIEFCNSRRIIDNEKDDHFWRKQFLDEYKIRHRVAMREGGCDAPKYLMGLQDSTNNQLGHDRKIIVVQRLGHEPIVVPYRKVEIDNDRQPKHIAELLPKLPDDTSNVKHLPDKLSQAERDALTPAERKIIEDTDGALF